MGIYSENDWPRFSKQLKHFLQIQPNFVSIQLIPNQATGLVDDEHLDEH